MVISCGGNPNTPTETSEEPTAPVYITFSGTLTVNGGETHAFTVPKAGGVVVVLADVTPNGVIVGLSLGTWNGGICTVVLASDDAAEGARLIGAITEAGNLCVRIYDTGNVTVPTAYSIQVEY
jgi:hypothetical protein